MSNVSIPSFPQTILTPFNCSTTGIPDHAAITLLETEVFANARAIYSPLGTGVDGHLFLVADGPTYIAITGAAAAPPIPANPGVHPVLVGANPTHAQISQAERVHKEDRIQFITSTLVEAALKTLILAAVPHTFLEELRDTRLAFSKVSCLTILRHLRTTYGTVTADDLKLNLQNLSRQWGPEQPLEDLWAQINRCQEFAATSTDPITDATIIRTTLDNIEQSGAFVHDVRDWRKLPIADQTLARLKSHFNSANIERCRILSSKSAGYAHNANAIALVITPPQHNAPPASIPNSHTYCWSHGLNLHPGRQPHTSKTCKTRLPGHCAEATLLNRMGGCNLIQSGVRDARVVWVRPSSSNNNENINPN
jgi:hypothetical protein